MITLIGTVDCPGCGGTAAATFHLTDDVDDNGELEVDLELLVTQQAFTCRDCSRPVYTGDLGLFTGQP